MSEWSRIEGLREGEVLVDGEGQEEDRRFRMRRGGEGEIFSEEGDIGGRYRR